MTGRTEQRGHTWTRDAALMWALGRVGLGVAALIAPGRLVAMWVGSSVPRPAAAVLGRALGGRDLVLGAGTARELLARRSGGARSWVRASGAADAVDAAATLLLWSGLPRRSRWAVTVAAAASALSAAALDRLLLGSGLAEDAGTAGPPRPPEAERATAR